MGLDVYKRQAGDYAKRIQAQVYREYQQVLRQNNALDFDDLIMKTVELFKLDGEVLNAYQERLRYIMVDEYQDTNTAPVSYTHLDVYKRQLLQGAEEELLQIAECSASMDGIFFVGLPYEVNGKLYNMAAVISGGEVLGMVPKSFLPNYNEFYERRHFTPGAELCTEVTLSDGSVVPVDRDLLFTCDSMRRLRIGVELCEDLWTPNPPSIGHALAGATVIVNLSASNEITGKDSYRRELVAGQSARLLSAYI